jgi:murein DD-endopeptidase MepM/ murein hydrolase activator NlpD
LARSRKHKKNIISSFFSLLLKGILLIPKGVSAFFKACDSKLTIMIVPHSIGKVVNFRTNVFALVFGVLLVAGVALSFFYFNHQASTSSEEIARLREENRQTLASLDELRDDNNNLIQAAKRFETTLSQSLALLGIKNTATPSKNISGNGDLSSLFDNKEDVTGTLQEAADIKQITAYLENAVQPIEEISKMLENQGTLFSDIPSVWPVKGGIGHVSMAFGQNVHPITGQWYIHKGMDFSTYRSGDPVIATANGQVVTVGYDSSFGNNVIIKHKHGMYTRYAHLSTIRVKKGQHVSQRDIIGTIGNTGVTTGPHLHYEVHIGSDVVDPAKYVTMKVSK